MTAFLYYLMKLTICSGVLYLFYMVGLRNKIFHQWNRFYLLASVVLSLALPLVTISVYHTVNEEPSGPLQMLHVVQNADQYMEEVTIGGTGPNSLAAWLVPAYALISALISFLLIRSLVRIFFLVRRHTVRLVQNIRFIDTNAPGTPFSFFDFVFWNRKIDLESSTGRHIFEHELVHVREKHSFDKVFLQIVLIFFWCNPFFWLIRRELRQIHEFIADQKSIGQKGTAVFAAMILQSAYPDTFHSLTNPFFQTSIKRRLAMITKIQNPGLNYLSRVAVLLVTAVTIFAFTVRTKSVHRSVLLDRELTVVIDAGHGFIDGKPSGARFGGANEDELALSIAKKVQELNTNQHIRIVLTRTGNENIELKKRQEIASKEKPDLFISVHLNSSNIKKDGSSSNPELNGMDIYVASKNLTYRRESEWLGSALVAELGSAFVIKPQLQTRQMGIYVIESSTCPSVLLECGYLTNQRDREFISREENQEQVARKILAGIERYASSETIGRQEASAGDTIPQKLKEKTKDEDKGREPGSNDGNSPNLEDPYTKVDVEAKVDVKEWKAFLAKSLGPVMKKRKQQVPAGNYTVLIRFMVKIDGSISDLSVARDPGHGLGSDVMAMMKGSPKWTPAAVEGRAVNSYRYQPISLVFTN